MSFYVTGFIQTPVHSSSQSDGRQTEEGVENILVLKTNLHTMIHLKI